MAFTRRLFAIAGMRPVMRVRQARRIVSAVLASTALAAQFTHAAVAPERLRVPPGFKIELLTDAVPNARAMALGRYADGRGVVYVGSSGAGKAYAVEIDRGRALRVHTIASGLDVPAGVAYREGSLYVSSISRIQRWDRIDDRLDQPPAPALVTDRLPSDRHHGAKYIRFGPDGLLYVAVGAPCNVCEPGPAHGLIERMKPDGSALEVVARGVRNSVGFDWSPIDRALWFSDNGRDMLGDDVPSDEINRLLQPGQHFGFPYCHQGDVPDPQFGGSRHCAEFVAPVARPGAHVATLGVRFYMGAQFPAEYRNNLFVAEHGSWNRSKKSGYQVVRLVVDGGQRVGKIEPFVEGFLQVDSSGRETVLGRPADVLPLPDGSLLVSDDLGGAIYRVTYLP